MKIKFLKMVILLFLVIGVTVLSFYVVNISVLSSDVKFIMLAIVALCLFLVVELFSLIVKREKETIADQYRKDIADRLANELKSSDTKNREVEGEKQEDEAGKTSYFIELVSINLTNLREYYLLVKKQTSNSFTISLIACIAGFVLIAMPMVISYFSPEAADISNISTFSGIVAEIISGLFFYLYSKTVAQLKTYHNSLLDVQNILLSFKLVDSIKDESQKQITINNMITSLLTKHVTNVASTQPATEPTK